MNRTKIEWVENPDGSQGWTWNPITGCTNHTDGRCKGGGFPCWAYKLANRRLKKRYLANENIAPSPVVHSPELHEQDVGEQLQDPFYPRFWPERLSEPLATMRATKKGWEYWASTPKGIFVCDMGDLFGPWIPWQWQAEIFQVFADCPDHRFYLLTKQPQELPRFSPFPENCYVGVTATGHHQFIEALRGLKAIEAKVRFLSIEPFLEPILVPGMSIMGEIVDWLIIGGQTNPTVLPELEWVGELLFSADRAGIPVFEKDNLAALIPASERPLRQEFPNLTS